MTPEQEWALLMARLAELATDAFYLEKKLSESGGKPASARSLFLAEQLDKYRALKDDLTAFHTARIAAAKESVKSVPQGVRR